MKWPWQKVKAGLKFPNMPREGEQVGDDVWIQYFGSLGGNSKSDPIPAAYAAVNLLSDQMSILQPCVYTPEGEPDMDHPVSSLLMHPNRTVDPWQFWNVLWRVRFTHGNSFAYIRRDFAGKPVELVPAWCQHAQYVDSRAAPYIKYRLELLGANAQGGLLKGRHVEATSRDVIAFHGPGLDLNTIFSPSPIMVAALSTVGMIKNVTKHQKQLTAGAISSGSALTLSSDAIPATSKKRLDEFKEILEMINVSVKSARENNTLPVMPPGVSVDRMQTLSNTDLQLVELLKWGVEDIARVWNLPPARLGHYYQGYRMTDMDVRGAEFVRFSIAPHVKMSGCQLTRKLLTPQEIGQRAKIDMQTEDLKKGTFRETVEAVKMAVSDGGFLTPNEGRAKLGYKPIAGGDKLLQPKGAPYQEKTGENDED